MYDSQGKIRKIVCITAGIWLISLLILFAQHGQTLTGVSPEHAQIVGSV